MNRNQITYVDDDETVGYYLDHVGARRLFEAARDTTRALAGSQAHFWTLCVHLMYPRGTRDGVLFHGTSGHKLAADNGLAMIIVPDLDNNMATLLSVMARLRGCSIQNHMDVQADAFCIEIGKEIDWP